MSTKTSIPIDSETGGNIWLACQTNSTRTKCSREWSVTHLHGIICRLFVNQRNHRHFNSSPLNESAVNSKKYQPIKCREYF